MLSEKTAGALPPQKASNILLFIRYVFILQGIFRGELPAKN